MCVFLGGSLSQGMVIAETKRQMHETLEMKEEEVAQLRGRVQQAVAQKEELQEQKGLEGDARDSIQSTYLSSVM